MIAETAAQREKGWINLSGGEIIIFALITLSTFHCVCARITPAVAFAHSKASVPSRSLALLWVSPSSRILSSQSDKDDEEEQYTQRIKEPLAWTISHVPVTQQMDGATNIRLKPLTNHKGFCNTLYLVLQQDDEIPPVAILKVYSNLAKARRLVSGLEGIDECLSVLKWGPQVFGSNHDNLLMEYMGDAQVFSSASQQDPRVLSSVARALAKLHSLDLTSTSIHSKLSISSSETKNNMLWNSVDVLLKKIIHDDNDDSHDGTMKRYFQEQVYQQRTQLEALDLTMTSGIGHGDLKASNIMIFSSIKSDQNEIRFIDLETAGKHYRAYDLAKFFRRPLQKRHPDPPDVENGDNDLYRESQTIFLRAYLEEQSLVTTAPLSVTEDEVEELRLESDLLLPMTWLEAALFFCASRQPSNWKAMAHERLEQYQIALQDFPATVQAYRDNKDAMSKVISHTSTRNTNKRQS